MLKDAPSQNSKDNSVRSRMERWQRESEERLNLATIESGVIPNLHELFEQKGLTEGYFIVDAIELTRGFPVNAYTRYIMPVLTDEDVYLDADVSEVHPGISIANIVSLSVRSLSIHIGLDNEDFYKIRSAMDRFTKEDAKYENLPVIYPPWWNYKFAEYITYLTPQDYEKKVDPQFEDVFWWGKHMKNPQIFDFMYEEETSQNSKIETVWDIHRERLQQALKEQNSIIDKVLTRAS